MRLKIDGRLTCSQSKQHIPHVFTMPSDATRLFIRLEYSPKRATGQNYNNMLCLTVFDPKKCRGARHNNPDQSLTITEFTSTPGYTPGKLQAGTWTIFIDTHRILPPEPIQYSLEIEISNEPLEIAELPRKVLTKPRGPGWYKGDLHGHTLHSDARWDVPDFAQYARDYKLDFVTLTDHNTVSALTQLDSLAGDDLLTMGGSELTTYYGHALALGVHEWQEWRVGTEVRMPDIAQKVKDKNGIFVIAHPKSIGDPECTGCDWHYDDMMPGVSRHVEIWNGPWTGDSGNEKGLRLWYEWLNQGYRMVASSGTDIHGPMEDPHPGFNYVYANDLSEIEILNGIRKGHLYLSSGPTLELMTDTHAIMGDYSPDSTTLFATYSGCAEGDVLGMVINGEIFKEHPIRPQGKFTLPLPKGAKWCVLELRNTEGTMKAITNPLFLAEGWR